MRTAFFHNKTWSCEDQALEKHPFKAVYWLDWQQKGRLLSRFCFILNWVELNCSLFCFVVFIWQRMSCLYPAEWGLSTVSNLCHRQNKTRLEGRTKILYHIQVRTSSLCYSYLMHGFSPCLIQFLIKIGIRGTQRWQPTARKCKQRQNVASGFAYRTLSIQTRVIDSWHNNSLYIYFWHTLRCIYLMVTLLLRINYQADGNTSLWIFLIAEEQYGRYFST